MISHDGSRKLCALALGLALAGAAARDARADAMKYSTLGSVDTPAGGIPSLVYFNGMSDTAVPANGSINLGSFVVSSLAKTGDRNINYVNDPFNLYVKSGSSSATITGHVDGMVGPTVSNPALTVTITGVNPYNGSTLPFSLNVPMNTPLPIAVSDGTGPASTTFSGASPSPIPEPTSVAVFAISLGGLGLWRRRRAGR